NSNTSCPGKLFRSVRKICLVESAGARAWMISEEAMPIERPLANTIEAKALFSCASSLGQRSGLHRVCCRSLIEYGNQCRNAKLKCNCQTQFNNRALPLRDPKAEEFHLPISGL